MKKLILILLLFLCSCISVKPTYILNSGRPIANPNYVLNDTGTSGLRLTFWFTSFKAVVDKDKTAVLIPSNEKMLTKLTFDDTMVLMNVNVEIYNPKQVQYTFKYETKIKKEVKTIIFTDYKQTVGGISNLQFRSYSVDLPVDKSILSGQFKGEILVNGEPMFLIGPFNYERKIIQEK